jgi:hypothetical protein
MFAYEASKDIRKFALEFKKCKSPHVIREILDTANSIESSIKFYIGDTETCCELFNLGMENISDKSSIFEDDEVVHLPYPKIWLDWGTPGDVDNRGAILLEELPNGAICAKQILKYGKTNGWSYCGDKIYICPNGIFKKTDFLDENEYTPILDKECKWCIECFNPKVLSESGIIRVDRNDNKQDINNPYPLLSNARFYLTVIKTYLTLLSCINVKQITKVKVIKERKLSYSAKKKSNIKTLSYEYKILNIDLSPVKVVNKYEDSSISSEVKKAMHFIRGSFRTYTSDAPLFGKHVGTWFWHPRIGGNDPNRFLDKDYVSVL